MRTCPECGESIGSDRKYCVDCSGNHEIGRILKPGILSGKTRDFVMRSLVVDGDIDRESIEYGLLLDEVAEALMDFFYLGDISGFNLGNVINERAEREFDRLDEDAEAEDVDYILLERKLQIIGLMNLFQMLTDSMSEDGMNDALEFVDDRDFKFFENLSLSDIEPLL